MYQNIPAELRLYPQWVVWKLEEQEGSKPTKVPYDPKTGRHAEVDNSLTWGTYDEAIHAKDSNSRYSGIGFVLTASDPFGFIDLDNPYELKQDGTYKHDKPDEVMQKQHGIYTEFDSYAERSPSGTGLHIIVKGAVPSGRKRSSIEVYSNVRFMTMTGDVYRNSPIKDHNDMLNVLWEQMSKGKTATTFYAGLDQARLTDEAVLEMAGTAVNGEKFTDLFYHGNWQKYYPSQSEADLALVDIIAFYSENRQQVQNLFLQSKLGQREKSRAQYRINYMLEKCFDHMLPPVDIEGMRNQLQAALEANMKKQQNIAPPPVIESPYKAQAEMPEPKNAIYNVPPGLVGEIAQYIYAQAPRPVPEIALAGALGLMAGIVGRAYNVSATGLNQYVLLLAGTGTGKEAIASGINKLMNAVIRTVPAATDFMGPGEIASSQALIKYMSKTANSFVSLVGEFGIYLQQMASVNAAPHLIGLRRMLLDLYNKSGEGQQLRPSIYSDKEKNTASVLSPALTIMGESTPEKFYEGLHDGMISEGLLPRFTIIEYHGLRVPLNEKHALAQPSFELIERLSTICAHSLNLNSQNKAIECHFSVEAKNLFDKFNLHADEGVNKSSGATKEVTKSLWTRAHIKAMKLAALLAVGNNPYEPVIDFDAANWAINLVIADVQNMLNRFNAGEVGIDNEESKQLSKVCAIVKDYIVQPWSEVIKYSGEGMAKLHGDKIVPYSYLQRRLASVATFKKDRAGATMAIKRALKTLAERGDLQEVSRATLSKDYNTSALSYAIISPKAFGI